MHWRMVQQIGAQCHHQRQTSRVLESIGALSFLVFLVAVGRLEVRASLLQARLLRLVNQDDWRGVRDVATAIIERPSRWIARDSTAQARKLLGLAHLVLGDLPAARAALDAALATKLPAPIEASAHRQLASVARAMGDFDGARARLTSPAASFSDSDRYTVAVQLAQVLIDAGDPAAAEQAVLPAIVTLEARRAGAGTSTMRTAFTADLTQARCILVRARIEQGDETGAEEVWDAAQADPGDDRRPYLHGQRAETGSRLALLRGDRTTAAELAEVASGRFAEVGARLDLARLDVLRARIDRDRAALDAAERELRTLGGLGYLREIEQARLEIEGLG